METIVIFTIAACLLSAGVMYVVLDYRTYDERKKALENVLRAQAEAASATRKLLGYTKYADYLSVAKQAIEEQMKFLAAKVVREYVHIEEIQKDALQLKSDATVIVKYSVEYSFGMDLKPESFELLGTASGIEIKIGKPTLVAAPTVKPLSYEIPGVGGLVDEKGTVTEIHHKLPALAQRHGAAMASEDAIRALCKMKLMEFLCDFLAKRPGVQQVPVISVVYK